MLTQLIDMVIRSTSELSASGMVLRLALVTCSMFAMVHLISMWGTRYGDNNTLAKSFFLSLVLHGCFGLGWATVIESYPRRPYEGEEELVQTPITFTDLDDSSPIEGKNKLPIWHTGPATQDRPLSREIRSQRRLDSDVSMDEIDSPETDKAPEATTPLETPDLAAQLEQQAPDLARSPDQTAKSAAVASSMSIDQPQLEARPETVARSAPSRSSASLPSTAIEEPTRPSGRRGAATRSTPTIEDGTSMTFPSEIAVDALPRPQGAPNDQTVRRQGSPSPAAIVDTVTGTGSDTATNSAERTTPRRSIRIGRSSDQPGLGAEDISIRPSTGSLPAAGTSPSLTSVVIDDRGLTGPRSLEPTDGSQQPNFERPKTPSMSRAPARAPETYQARTSGQRMSSALKRGGSEKSERAVENSLKWLSGAQESDGRWSSIRFGGGAVDKDPQGEPRLDGGKYADSGVTGLVVLSFLGAGYTHEGGPYSTEVRQALDWLISQQKPENGYLGGDATKYDQNYCHAMATFALAEAYAMQKDANEFPELRNAVRRAVRLIAALQNEDGGWRYSRVTESDMSMFGWQLMALKSAVNAGIPVPEKTRRGMVDFLDARGRGDYGGLAGYKRTDPPTPAMTAEALFCRQMFSVRSNDAASQEAVTYLRRHLPRITSYDEYYWYYGTLAMSNADDKSWQEWNSALRDLLVSLQRQDGSMAGSWDPRGKWAGIGGRLYSTALSTMCLEVYYRYQTGSKPSADQ